LDLGLHAWHSDYTSLSLLLLLFLCTLPGYSRDEILGQGLFDLLQPAALSVAPSRREQLQAEAQAGMRFVLHGQVREMLDKGRHELRKQ